MTNQEIQNRIEQLERIVKREKAYKAINESYNPPLENSDRDLIIEELEKSIFYWSNSLKEDASV